MTRALKARSCGIAASPHDSLYQQDDDDGPQNYFLFYLPWCLHPGAPHLGAPDECLEILDIYSIADIACRMRAVQPGPVEQADKAVKDLAARAGRIFTAASSPGKRQDGAAAPDGPNPFASSSRPMFLTTISQVVAAAEADVKHLAWQCHADQAEGRARSRT